MTIFTAITLEGWVDSMYNVNDSYGQWWLVAIYWVFLVLFGAFFVMNLALAVVYEEYEKSQNELLLEEEEANETAMGRLVGEALKAETEKLKAEAEEAARIKAWGETTENSVIAAAYSVAVAEYVLSRSFAFGLSSLPALCDRLSTYARPDAPTLLRDLTTAGSTTSSPSSSS